ALTYPPLSISRLLTDYRNSPQPDRERIRASVSMNTVSLPAFLILSASEIILSRTILPARLSTQRSFGRPCKMGRKPEFINYIL
ncbi:MAG: hypothetical protein IJH11_05855, partial [Lachnospiraceae bacterium]|nr:hypothetical protein [Lachnospiraceae bacterium]